MIPKKRIIHLVHNLQVGGVEAAVRSSIDHLNEEYEFWVVSLHPNDPDFIKNITYQKQIVCFNLHTLFAPINLIKLLWFIAQIKPSMILSSLWKSHSIAMIISWFKPKLQIIPIIHSSQFFHWLDRFFTLIMIRKAKLVLCDSNSSKRFIDALTRLPKTEVLSFKINHTKLGVTLPKEFKQGVFDAVFIGRLSSEKRLDRALKLVSKLIENGIAVTFHIYGPDHHTESNLRALANNLGINIKIHGAISPDQVNEVLSRYHFFIQLSDVEGMAITVVQAMQQGLIPIVTRVGEMQYYVQHEQNGLVVSEPFDELTLITQQIVEMVKLPAQMQKMSASAEATFVKQPIYTEHLNQLVKQQLGA